MILLAQQTSIPIHTVTNLTPWPQLILEVGIWLKLAAEKHIWEYVDSGPKELSQSLSTGCWSYK